MRKITNPVTQAIEGYKQTVLTTAWQEPVQLLNVLIPFLLMQQELFREAGDRAALILAPLSSYREFLTTHDTVDGLFLYPTARLEHQIVDTLVNIGATEEEATLGG